MEDPLAIFEYTCYSSMIIVERRFPLSLVLFPNIYSSSFTIKIRVMPEKIGGKCLFPEPFIGNTVYFVRTFLFDYLTESVKVVNEKRKSFVNNVTK